MTSPSQRSAILDARAITRALEHMASGITELAGKDGAKNLMLIGIQRRGVELADRIAQLITARTGAQVSRGALDITLYRDDLATVGPKPLVGETHIPGELAGKCVVIVDDVLYTGRTIRAALDELADFGRPARIGLAVLIDRGGRELPIQADVIGETVKAAKGDRVDVFLTELDGKDVVELVKGAGS